MSNPDDATKVRACFAGLYSLSEGEEGVEEIVSKAISESHDFVLKPQREGGGNNFYGKQIEEALTSMTPRQRSAFILMDRIVPPPSPIHILREGEITDTMGVCELGIYGLFLRYEQSILTKVSNGEEVIQNSPGGHLLRTKIAAVEDGGVAAGVAVLDSPYLV